ncbi:hypothetical protein AVEN_216689-1, partial [Araneus ventricosus]
MKTAFDWVHESFLVNWSGKDFQEILLFFLRHHEGRPERAVRLKKEASKFKCTAESIFGAG